MLMLISELSLGDSPRLSGENIEHTRLLADSEAELPPILVCRRTLRVVDGLHRIRAALLRGDEKIAVRFFDGDDADAFVMAVQANIEHGLPLSLADRESAAIRIITSHPQWSDRVIASVTGLSARKISTVRRTAAYALGVVEVRSRIGRDGRVRPLNGADGRRRASELFALRPDASLRAIAGEAGISLGTARDVRNRLRRGDDPVPPRQRAREDDHEPVPAEQRLRRVAASGRVSVAKDAEAILHQLQRDPSVRFTESGRTLIRWLNDRMICLQGWESMRDTMPPHCAYLIADLACAVAEEWLDFAESVRHQAENTA